MIGEKTEGATVGEWGREEGSSPQGRRSEASGGPHRMVGMVQREGMSGSTGEGGSTGQPPRVLSRKERMGRQGWVGYDQPEQDDPGLGVEGGKRRPMFQKASVDPPVSECDNPTEWRNQPEGGEGR